MNPSGWCTEYENPSTPEIQTKTQGTSHASWGRENTEDNPKKVAKLAESTVGPTWRGVFYEPSVLLPYLQDVPPK